MRAELPLLPDRMARHAAMRPRATAFRFVDRPAGEVRELTWGDLWGGASATAGTLTARGLRRQRVGIACQDAADFVVGLAACFLSGNAAVPFPVALSRRSAPRARSILDAARPKAVLLSPDADAPDWLSETAGRQGAMAIPVAPAADQPNQWQPQPVAASDLALVQFSSGSTGTPKGVGLSHCNIAANCAAIVQTYGLDENSRGVCWLPLHHDMGLVGHVLTTMLVGGQSTLMNPLRFLQRPLNWLRLVAQERAVITSAPNFGYELCARAAEGEDLSDIDLSCLTAAICGGEPVLRATTKRFIAMFAPVGFAPAAFSPSYGLAEATLLVACGRNAAGPRFVAAEGGPPDGNDKQPEDTTNTVADLGPPVAGLNLRIVDEVGRPVAGGVVGEIEISGTSVGRLVAEDGELAPAAALRTGDLGFLRGGHLHVVGRQKDLIIVRGENVHPSDVEAAALEAHAAIIPGGIAAIGVEVDGTQEIVVLVEADRAALSQPQLSKAIRSQVSECVARRVGHVPAKVVVMNYGALPRTSSGKVRRFEAAGLLRSGALAGYDQRSPADETAK